MSNLSPGVLAYCARIVRVQHTLKHNTRTISALSIVPTVIPRDPRITPTPSLSSRNMFGCFFVGLMYLLLPLSLCAYPSTTSGRNLTLNNPLAPT